MYSGLSCGVGGLQHVGMAQFSDEAGPQFNDFEPDSLRGTEGFFRVGKTRAGSWWLLDGRDRAFFCKGVAAVNRAGVAGGRRLTAGAYANAIDAKFGVNDPAAFAEDVLARLRRWNFNALGPWAGSEFFDRGMAWIESLEFRKAGDVEFRLGDAHLPDVFDPRWVEDCERWARTWCAPRRRSLDLIGYFSDHDLGWAQPPDDGDPPLRPTLLQICLSLEPSFAGYHAAWEFVLAPRQGQLSTLADDWGISLTNREALRQLTLEERPLVGPGYLRDQERFSREFARRYFGVVAAAIRRNDPNHLVLGSCYAALPGAAVLAESGWPQVDVVSIDGGQADLPARLRRWQAAAPGPLLVGDFSWAGADFTQSKEGDPWEGLSEIERMHHRGRAALEALCAHPAAVGYVWSRWAQGDPWELPPFAHGLMYTNDHAAWEHVLPMAAINARAEALHAGCMVG